MHYDLDKDGAEEYPVRRCRRKDTEESIYADIASSSDENVDSFSEFDEPSSDDDDDLYTEAIKRSHKRKPGSQRRNVVVGRPTDGLYQHRQHGSDSDSDTWDGVASESVSENSIAQRRSKRATREIDYRDDAPTEGLGDEESASATPEMLDAPPLAGVETIMGLAADGRYLVRVMRSSNADALWLTKEELEERPGGPSHLSVFNSLIEEHGSKPSKSMPQLVIPASQNEEHDRVIDHVVTLHRESGLYLVKWQDVGYEDATWECEVSDEHALEVFRRREEFIPRVPKPVDKTFRDYGDGEGCIPLPMYKNGNELRPYQIKALNWLRFHYHTQMNSILADEMGLGKTVMCIALLHDIVSRCDVRGPFLIVAPLSTLPNWQREFENWTDMNAIVLHGSKPGREVVKRYELFYESPNETVPKVQVVLTNVETVAKELDVIQSIKWHFVIIDEAHRLKNTRAKIYGMLYSLRMDHILLMTGTPIQNNIDEIFALLRFIAPAKFRTLEEFRAAHHNMESAEDVEKLQKALMPYMLRRKKCDVDKSIAAKEETIVEVELTRTQKFYYRLLIDRKADDLISGHSTVRVRELNNLAMQLRKVCNHPFLLPDAEAEIVEPGQDPVDAMISSCGKLVFVDKLLAKLSKTGTKVLIFSQMVRVLNILEDFLNYRKYKYERLDGRVHGMERQASIDRFNDPDSQAFVFLLCTKAGGVGLNLTAASTVVIYDSDWNPQNDVQAQARCHRIGQTHDVQVYRLVTRGTYESEMFLRASMKLGLDQAILDSRPERSNNMSAKEIEILLKKGAYHVMADDDESEIDKFVTEDIDEMLERRTKKLSSSAIDSESMFSKASFVVERDGEQLDLNDEHFWEKVVPKERRRAKNTAPETARMRKSRSSEIYDIGTDDEEEYGSSWSIPKRDKLLNLMLSNGYGRWDVIHEKIKSMISWEMMVDGSAAILFLISQSIDNPETLSNALFESKSIELTTRQHRLLTTDLFTSRRFREHIKKHGQTNSERLCRLKAIGDWINGGCKKLRYDATTAPKEWSPDYDTKLLMGVWKYGWGEWKAILGDNEIWNEEMQASSKFISCLTRRLMAVTDALLDGRAFDMLITVTSTLKSLTTQTAKTLVSAITAIGECWERIGEVVEIDEVESICPVVANCARMVAALDHRSSQAVIKATVKQYYQEAEVLAAALPYANAKKLRDNMGWIQRLRDFVAANTIEDKLFKKTPKEAPSWWKPVHSRLLFERINTWGLWNLPSFLLETDAFSSKLDEDDRDYVTTLEERFRKDGRLRTVKGDLACLLQDGLAIRLVEEIIERNGGWRTPPYIDIPESAKQGITMPFSDGCVTVESLGKGRMFMWDGFLYQAGYRARVQHKTSGYRVTVISEDKFEVWKSDRAKWQAASPDEVWEMVDKRFDGDGIESFGLKCPMVQYAYMKWAHGDIPEDYVAPKIQFYQTELVDAKKRRGAARTSKSTKAAQRKPQAKKKKNKRKARLPSSSDSTDEDDSPLDYDEDEVFEE